jgi:hypothetical protein
MQRLGLIIVLALSFATANLFASTKSTILGTVRDTSGAVVPGATVKVTSENMLINRVIKSDSAGDYVAADLDPGIYTITVDLTGFKTFTRTGVTLDVEQSLRVDVSLEVGDVTQKVQVSGQPPLVETDSSSVGQLIGANEVVNLPLNGRFFLSLALLTPGSNAGYPGNHQAGIELGGTALAVNGARSSSNNYMMDGVDNNEGWQGYVSLFLSVDAIQEFKVQTGMSAAEYGRSAGAQVNIVTKNGTNNIHGSMFEYVRNDKFDANSFFSNSAGLPKPPYRRNQFGGSFGGPVYIPGVYDGRNRTFFFIDYEGTRIRQPETLVSTVPTALMRKGNFSELLSLANPIQIYDSLPADIGTGPRVPFQGNIIPPGDISASSTYLQQYVPPPNGPGLSGNFTRNGSASDDTNQLTLRIDQRVYQNGQFMARFTYDHRPVISPDYFGTPAVGNGGFSSGCTEDDDPRVGAIGYTHSLRPNLVNDFRFGYNRFDWLYYSVNHTNYGAEAGIQGLSADPHVVGFPNMNFVNFASWGDGQYLPNLTVPDETWEGTDSVTWSKGKHTVKAGWDSRRNHRYFLSGGALRGAFSFNGIFTASAATGGTGGYDYADFLLGYPASDGNVVGTPWEYSQEWFHDFYVQDDIKATPRLTLNLGLRYELNMPATEEQNKLSNFNFVTGTQEFANGAQILAGYNYPTSFAGNRSTLQTYKKNFDPRIGFAYRLTSDNKTSLRAAYGVFTDWESGNIYLDLDANPPYQYSTSTALNLTTPTTTYANAFAVVPGFSGFPGLSTMQSNYRDGTLQEWQTSLEREVSPGLMVSVAYVGTKGSRLLADIPANVPTPGPGIIQSRLPYPLFAEMRYVASLGRSSYNSLQAKVEKRMSYGLTFLSSYTWSHSLDLGSTVYDDSYPDPFNINATQKGPSDFDQIQRFVQSWLYDLPVGRGRHFLATAPRAVDYVLGGWTIGGIYTYGTGFPFSATIGSDVANIGTGGQRADVVGNWHVPNPSINGWFNPTAFQDPEPYTFGNSSRNLLRGPSFSNLDFSIAKHFRVTEGSRLSFRCEMFNTANHANFGYPNGDIDSTSAGQIFSTVAPNREIQLALRYEF